MPMFPHFTVCCVWMLAFISPSVLSAQQNLTFAHDGLTRTYHLYTPANLSEHAPLVFVLHGYMQTNNWAQSNLSFNAIADTAGFVVCYPQGTTDILGFNHWNSGLNVSDTDDIGFLSALAGYLQMTYSLDPNCTFTCGFSNGGFMSYTLACQAPNVFRAVGSVSGTMSGETWSTCNTSNTTPVVHFHGIDDGTIPIEGRGGDIFGWGGAPRIRTIVDFWSDNNQASVVDSNQETTNTERFVHQEGIGGNEVWYYEIANHGHEWPGSLESGIVDNSGIHASKIIWSFFRQFCIRLSTHADIYVTNQSISLSGQEMTTPIVLKGSLSAFDIRIIFDGGTDVLEPLDDVYVIDPSQLNPGVQILDIAHPSSTNLLFSQLISE